MAERAVDAVIFDMDGVLLDSERAWDEVREELTAEHGGRWHDAAQRDMMGMNSQEWPAYMRTRLGVNLDDARILRMVTDALAARYRVRLPLLPGADTAVRALAGRWPLAVASSSPAELIEAALAAAGLRDAFAHVVSSEAVPRGKPAPDVYLLAARRLGAPAGRCVAVEDSGNGILAGLAAGMAVVAIPNPDYPPPGDVLRRCAAVLTGIAALTTEVVAAAAG
ncbi:MAG: HAD family phosphatase [Thermoleophilia bacterium]